MTHDHCVTLAGVVGIGSGGLLGYAISLLTKARASQRPPAPFCVVCAVRAGMVEERPTSARNTGEP